jgi:hypothetical protein
MKSSTAGRIKAAVLARPDEPTGPVKGKSERVMAGEAGLAWREFFRRMGEGSLPASQVPIRQFLHD